MRRPIKYLSAALALLLAFAAAGCIAYSLYPLPLKASPLQFSIKPGSSLRSATQQMVEAGVLRSAV